VSPRVSHLARTAAVVVIYLGWRAAWLASRLIAVLLGLVASPITIFRGATAGASASRGGLSRRRRRFTRRRVLRAVTPWPFRHPTSAAGKQLGTASDQRPQLLQEADAVGAQVLRDKVAWKLRLTPRRSLGLFAWSGNNSPPVCGNGGKLQICSDSLRPQRLWPQAPKSPATLRGR